MYKCLLTCLYVRPQKPEENHVTLELELFMIICCPVFAENECGSSTRSASPLTC